MSWSSDFRSILSQSLYFCSYLPSRTAELLNSGDPCINVTSDCHILHRTADATAFVSLHTALNSRLFPSCPYTTLPILCVRLSEQLHQYCIMHVHKHGLMILQMYFSVSLLLAQHHSIKSIVCNEFMVPLGGCCALSCVLGRVFYLFLHLISSQLFSLTFDCYCGRYKHSVQIKITFYASHKKSQYDM